MACKVFLKNLFTGKDNETFDIGRVLWALSCLTFLGISILTTIQGQPFHPMEWGTGLSAVLAGGGISVAVKSHTEPDYRGNDG